MFGVTDWLVGDLLVSNCGYLWVCFDLGLLICWFGLYGIDFLLLAGLVGLVVCLLTRGCSLVVCVCLRVLVFGVTCIVGSIVCFTGCCWVIVVVCDYYFACTDGFVVFRACGFAGFRVL